MDSRRYNIFMDNLDFNSFEETLDDETFRKQTTKEITRRDKFYSNILEHFISITKTRNYIREFFKWLFLCALIAAIIQLTDGLSELFQRYATDATISEITEAIPLFITSIVRWLTDRNCMPAEEYVTLLKSCIEDFAKVTVKKLK